MNVWLSDRDEDFHTRSAIFPFLFDDHLYVPETNILCDAPWSQDSSEYSTAMRGGTTCNMPEDGDSLVRVNELSLSLLYWRRG